MRLYDRSEFDTAGFRVGDRWRATQAERCWICGCLSNEFRLIGMYGVPWRIVLVCPGKERYPELHQELQEKLYVLNSQAHRHPRIYLEALRQEVAELRRRFADVPPNVEGIDLDVEHPT